MIPWFGLYHRLALIPTFTILPGMNIFCRTSLRETSPRSLSQLAASDVASIPRLVVLVIRPWSGPTWDTTLCALVQKYFWNPNSTVYLLTHADINYLYKYYHASIVNLSDTWILSTKFDRSRESCDGANKCRHGGAIEICIFFKLLIEILIWMISAIFD
jgi:hypothetical protein